ncbi:serine protease [Thiocystis violacea]|uniref:serine protease n=1 Tax=Thiocystis violacea TaxID=13725 RepID=UPI0019072F3B|nr:serine protease [Thiocystis violacea]MBK1721832.1 hypothetical protein [Thiocystis violacea]
MERDRLSGRLIPLIFLAASGAASAVDVMPQQRPVGAATEAQHASVQRLRAMIGQRPAASAARVELTAEEHEKIAADNAKAPSGKPLKVGIVKGVDVNVDLQPLDVAAMSDQTYSFAGGTVRRADGQLTWVMRLDSAGAAGARLRFDNVALPAGGSIYLYNDAGEVEGPYTGATTSFWSGSVTGDALYIHVQVPEGASDDARLSIGAVLLFDGAANPFCAINAPCIEDGSCHTEAEWPAIEKARKAIAHINFIQDGASYLCSGGLLADTDPATSIPYFLTANHCISDSAVAATVEAWFDYKTPFCNAGCQPILPGTASTLGATLLDHSAVDDHSLLVLDTPPPEWAWYLGWTDTSMTPLGGNAEGTLLFRLSHPLGSPQAFSQHRVDRSADCALPGLPYGPFIFSRDLVGSTEGGSSGAPVMLADGRVVGQLYGACGYYPEDACDRNNSTVDGAFAHYYPDVAKWLAPDPEQLPLTVQKFGTGQGRVLSSLGAGSEAASAVAQSTASAQPRLLGGEPVEQSEWPWQAALKISTWRLNGSWTCGGSVIHPNWILTAAHCIVDDSDDRYNTVSPSNIEVRTGSTRFEYGGQTSKVKRIVKHPEFNPLTLNHDIALIELKSPVYVDPLRPVTWEREPDLACPGTASAVTGWTPTELCGLTATLLSKVDASIANPDTCRTAYGDAAITQNMLCTTSAATDDEHCQADDGSPLVVENGRGGYAQAGIVSWGNGCDEPAEPTVYTRLASHVEWMETVTGEDLSSEAGPSVIDCGSTCSNAFAKDSLVTLMAEADPGSLFAGWDGACAGKDDSCEVTMTQALNVKAVFNAVRADVKSCSPGSP